MKIGLLFIGHGTRLKVGVQEFESFVASVVHGLKGYFYGKNLWFHNCFLELQEPDIPSGVEAAILSGCDVLIAIPVFLFSAKHIKTDIPQQLFQAKTKYPELPIIQIPPFGPDKAVIEACLYRLIEGGWTPDIHQSSIILVGRGGNDHEARSQFARLSSLIANHLNVNQARIKRAFLAGQGPSLNEALAECRKEGFHSVYVVPVLLFNGLLTGEIGRVVASWNQKAMWNGMSVVLISHLQNHFTLIKQLEREVAKVIGSIETVQVVQ